MSNFSRFTALVAALCACLAGTAGDEGLKGAETDSNVVERFEIAGGGEEVLLPVKFRGKNYRFLVDTGASRNAYDSGFTLGEPLEKVDVAGAEGRVHFTSHTAPDASLGGLSLRTFDPVFALDFATIREVYGKDVYGIIGMPFLRTHVVRIDFDKGTLSVLKEPGRDAGNEFGVTFNAGGSPVLALDPCGDKLALTLDTGHHGITWKEDAFAAAVKRGDLTVTGRTLVESLSGTSVRRIG